ncbi:MAG: hypothetical protein A2931_03345 [Candidatus Niyogibacteria bacterium RIFCSPLOWO2_01_FULL_45_48]|uniref:Uncharacterized protein n=1 Tax=Candidatus Niyogibacteria bacterium RIFCSPLOWO2_01_FULL_45_48 TaxID=1801724 RepID=A0A1G2EVL1_9BACT|nr:MAG: hypothetical protein A2931_03345 [Candidatus Niyogibacteria bacterium RIFCSPLOWO2_01_FULL_45_48]
MGKRSALELEMALATPELSRCNHLFHNIQCPPDNQFGRRHHCQFHQSIELLAVGAEAETDQIFDKQNKCRILENYKKHIFLRQPGNR